MWVVFFLKPPKAINPTSDLVVECLDGWNQETKESMGKKLQGTLRIQG